MSRRRNIVTGIGAAAVLLLVAALARHPLAMFLVSRGAGIATGYDVRFDDMQLGWSHAVFRGVHVGKNGDPVLDAARIDVDYALRDIFPGGKHRYGFAGIAIDRPVLTLLRHKDGSFNFNRGGTSSSPPAPTQAAAAPLFFSARVRDGTIRLIDAAPREPDLAEQDVDGVSIDASVASDSRTVARVDGTLVGRRTRTGRLQRWPLQVRSVIDYGRAFAMNRLVARALPLRGMLSYLVHDPTVRFDDGILEDVDALAYAVDIAPNVPFAYRLGGGARLARTQLHVGPLAEPVRDLHGRLDLFDDGVTTTRLAGTVAGTPLVIRGGMYDFANLQFRLGIAADPQLAQLRKLFVFLNTQPIRGPMHLETLVTSTVAQPLIRSVVSGAQIYYNTIPLERVGGVIDYEAGTVSFSHMRARFGAIDANVNGKVDVNVAGVPLEAVLGFSGPASSLPYAQQTLGGETLAGDALISGTGAGGFRIRGTMNAAGADGSGEGFVAVDERGRGEFGPFIFRRRDGSSLAGALRLERPISASAGWIDVHDYRIDVPARAAVLPGLSIPGFPAVGGVVTAAVVAGGPPSAFVVAGRAHASDAHFERYALGTVDLELAGSFADLRLRDIALNGPAGRFRGDGAVAHGVFAVTGQYDGTLEMLRPFTGDLDAHGAVHAPVSALADGNGITVQTSGADLRAATIHGIAIAAAAGTIGVDAGGLRVVAAGASIGGARAVAASHDHQIAVAAVGIPAPALRGTGLPLQAGRLTVFGLADTRGPAFHGSVDLTGGRAATYPVAGSGDVDLNGASLRLRDGVAAIGTSYSRLAGRLDGIGTPAFRYDLGAQVTRGDVGALARDLRLPVRYLEGSFAANVRIAGYGAAPSVTGSVGVPEGSINGLAFRDAAGRVALSPAAQRVDDGRVTVGSTQATFRAAVGPSRLMLDAASGAANLADFNDYFDQSDSLAGTGALQFAFDKNARSVASDGRVMLQDVRVRRFPLGTVSGTWTTRTGSVVGDLAFSAPTGGVHIRGTALAGAGSPQDALLHARVDADVSAQHFDLGTWLPAAGITAPIAGAFSGDGHIAGVYPHIAVAGSATLTGGRIGRFAIASATAKTHVTGNQVILDQIAADLGFAQLSGSGTIGLNAPDALALHVHASIPDLALASEQVAPKEAFDIAGALEADAAVSGTVNAPRVTLGFDIEKARYERILVQSLIGSVESDLRTIVVDSLDVGLNHGSAVLAGSVPIALNPVRVGPPAAPLSVTLNAHSVNLAALSELVPGAGTKLTGTVDGLLTLEGTVRAPQVLGTLTLSGGSYVSKVETSPIADAGAQLTFEGTSVRLQSLHAKVGAGTLQASGDLNLPIPGAPSSAYSVAVVARNAQLNFPAYGGGTLDGDAQIVGGSPLPTLSGNVTITNGLIPFEAIYKAATAPSEPAAPAPVFDLAFNLQAEAKSVRVKSSIIDVGATGNLALTGTLRSPRLAGELTATRGGTFTPYQRFFRIRDARVTFDPAQGIVPNLDLVATAQVDNPDPDPSRNPIGSAYVTVALNGPADDYHLTYSSDPPYSQDQIIALLANVPGVNFRGTQPPGTLRGAPGESNALLPPGVTPYPTSTYSFQQEAFSLFNTQLTQYVVAPLETFLGGGLGLTDLQLTLDYGGRVGYVARQKISKKREVFATLSQILSYPTRTQIGLSSRPNAVTSANFSYFQQNGTLFYSNSIFGATSTVTVLNGVQPLSGRQGFNFTVTRSYP